MVCPKCGHPNPDIAQFCGKCGGPLAAGQQQGSMAPGSTAVSSETKVVLIIATILLPLIGMIMGVIYLNSDNPARRAAGRTLLLVGVGVGVLYCILSLALSNSMT